VAPARRRHLPVCGCSTINDVVSKQSATAGGAAALAGGRRSPVPADAEYIRAPATVGRRGGTVGGGRPPPASNWWS